MKLQQMLLITVLGLSTLPTLGTTPAQACTPAPDNPNGCDGLNGGTPRVDDPRIFQRNPQLKRPIGTGCLQCPPEAIRVPGNRQLSKPVVQEKNILLNQGRFNRQFEQPQSFAH